MGLNRTVPVEDNPNSERPDAGQATEIVDDDEDTSCYTPDTSIDESVIDDQEENTEFEKPCLFVLCSGCIRMLSIHFSADAKSKFKKRAPLDDGPGLVVTTCRACSKQLMSQRLVTATKFVQQTTMWACARKVAGEDVDIFETSGMIVHVSVEELARILSIDCRVHPIDTNAETLGKLNEVNRSDLVLPYMPGGFF